MDKIKALLEKLGIELTADQYRQLAEVAEMEFVPAQTAAADKAKLEELTHQLEERSNELDALKSGDKSAELTRQLDELNAKYKQDTEALNAKLAEQTADYAAERLFGGYKFVNDRVRKSVLDEFKGKGFKLEDGEFIGGKEFLDGLKQSEPDIFAQEKGLFMSSTQSTAANESNLETQIYSHFGLNND